MSTRKRNYSTYAKGVAAGAAVVSAAKRGRTSGPTATSLLLAKARGRIAGRTRRAGYYGRFTGRGSELKFFDTTLAFTIDLTGEVPATGQLVLIPQGVTESTRVGRKCVIKSILIKASLLLTPAAAAAPAGNTVIYLVQDMQTNGAAAAVTDCFTGATLPTAVHNMANSSRFKILKKFTHSWNPQAGATTAYAPMSKLLTFYRKCNIPLEYSSTTGAITELKSNNIFLFAGADSGTIDDLVAVNGVCRVRFSDG